MAGLDTMKYIIEALRTKNHEPGVQRPGPGGVPIRYGGKMAPLGKANRDLNYVKYQRQQDAMGESPVSYEEWMGSQ